MKSKNWLLFVSFIAIICFIAVLAYGVFYAPHQTTPGSQKESRPIVPTYMLNIALIIFVIALIPLFYFFIYGSLQKNFDQNMIIISNILKEDKTENNTTNITQEPVNYASIILNFLSYNEKKVVNKLIEQKGSALQSEISRMESMGKVKTHRIVKDLEKKGIIIIEKYGNTNRINLTENLRKILIK